MHTLYQLRVEHQDIVFFNGMSAIFSIASKCTFVVTSSKFLDSW